jgi:hypothetical protein
MAADFREPAHLPNLRGDRQPASPARLPRQRAGVTPQMHGRYRDYDVVREAPHWDEVTRRVLLDRIENVPEGPRCGGTPARLTRVCYSALDGAARRDPGVHAGRGQPRADDHGPVIEASRAPSIASALAQVRGRTHDGDWGFDSALKREEHRYECSTVGKVAMIVLVWLALAAALIGIVVYAIRVKRLRNTPEELRGDWWPRFEAEFRAYVRERETPGRGTRERSSPPRRTHRRDLAEGSA